MMLLPIVAAMMAPPSPDQLLDKLTGKLKNGFAMDFTLKHGAFPGEIKGRYEYMPSLNAYFRATGLGNDYVFIIRNEGAIEIEHNTKLYYEIGPMGDIYATDSSLSFLSMRAFPYFIGRAKPKTAIPSFNKFRYVKEEAIDGIVGHRIIAGEAKESLEAWITTDGRLLRYVHSYTDEHRPVSADFRFGPLQKPNPSRFTLMPPKGYRPLALPRNPQPIYPGTKIPVTGWLDSKGSKVSLPIKGNTFIVVTRRDCQITSKAAGMIAEIAGKANVIVLSDSGAPKGLEKYPIFRDPGRATIDRMMTQATPFFMAVNNSGVLLQAWMGFNPREQAALKKEIMGIFDK